MDTAACKKLEEEFVKAVNERNFAHFDKIFADDLSEDVSSFPRVGSRRELVEILEELVVAFPDFRATIVAQIAEGDKVAVYWKATATHKGQYKEIPPTGKKVEPKGVYLDQIKGGRIVRRDSFNNYAEIFAELKKAKV